MLTMTDLAARVVKGSHTRHYRVESWIGGSLLAADIPISTGSEEGDSSLAIPERVTLSVPRLDGGVDWSPGTDVTHPLAAYGQRLKISLGVGVGNSEIEWFTRGWYLITSSSTEWDSVRVEAVNLLALIDEAKFAAPFQPAGQLTEVVQALVHPALTTRFVGLSDRAAPSGLSWDQNRLEGLFELLDAWPAHARMANDGILEITPPLTSRTPVLRIRETDSDYQMIRWSGDTTRTGAFNVVVARGKASDGQQIQGVVTDNTIGSPFAISGNFNPLPVPHFYNSDFLTTVDQCRLAASNLMLRMRQRTSQRISVSMVPNPAVQLDDVWQVTAEGMVNQLCAVDRLSLPYTADGGPMSVILRLI